VPHRFGVAVPLLWPIDAQAMGQTVITKGRKLLDDKSAGAAHKIEQEWRAAFIDASIGFADRKTDKIQLDHLHRQNPSGLEELVVKLSQQEATTITIPDTWETVLEGKHKREIFPKAVHEHRVVDPRPENGQLSIRKPKIDPRKVFGRKWSSAGMS
jgi:hypothetical protein